MNIKQSKEGWWGIEQDSHVFKWIQETGRLDHDAFLPPIACNNMPVGGIVMDCGALYGDHTIAYAEKVGKDGLVIAIEPNPLAYECLSKNATKFASPILCIHAAISDTHGGKAVHTIETDNIGAATVSASQEPADLGTEIRVISIDGFVNDALLPSLHFIKIDCEGWELKILQGAKHTITSFKPILLIEINQHTLSLQNTKDTQIYDLLLSLDYSWRIVQPNCTGGSPMFDIMCWPNRIETPKIITNENNFSYKESKVYRG